MLKKRILIIILILASIFIVFSGYEYLQAKGVNMTSGEMTILVLCVDPSEFETGIGGADAIIILKTKNWQIDSVEPIWPGHIYHPTATPPNDLKEHLIQWKLDPTHYYLHDCFWEGDAQAGAKLATETLEYNTKIKTNFVIIINPYAVDAVIQAVGPIYVPGQGYINGGSIELLRDERINQGISRRNALNSLFNGILTESKDTSKYPAIIYAMVTEYLKGNIKLVT